MRVAVVLALLIFALCAANATSVAAPRSETLLPPSSLGAGAR